MVSNTSQDSQRYGHIEIEDQTFFLFLSVFSVFLAFSLIVVIFHFRFFCQKTVEQVARKIGH